MPRGKCTFRQRDLVAACRAIERAGLSVRRIEITPDGRILVEPAAPREDSPEPQRNDFDELMQ